MNDSINITATVKGWSTVECVASNGDKKKLARFSMVAYTGGKMSLAEWENPVIVDLSGLGITEKARPILKDHNSSHIVGHTDSVVVENGELHVSGIISGTGSVADEIVASSKNGFPWQASIGARAGTIESVHKDSVVSVNGREFDGPVDVVRSSSLGEVSFVALGADDETVATVAARAASTNNRKEDYQMSVYETWVEAQGFASDDLTEDQTANLRALYDASQTSPAIADEVVEASENSDPVAELRAEFAAEAERAGAINKICNGDNELAAMAIAQGWDTTRTELEYLRAARPVMGAPAVIRGSEPVNDKVLEAATCMTAGVSDKTMSKGYDERTLDAADKFGHIGLRELTAACARLEGKDIPAVFGDGTATIKAGFSTVSLPNILENVLGKVLLESYAAQEVVAPRVCRVTSVSDFKQVSRVRLLGNGIWNKVAAGGEVQSGILDDQKYTNQADTYGQVLTLDRKTIVNDDLGAFLEIPREMGRAAAASIDDAFFTSILSNPSSFFAAGNNNYISGADTAFGPDSLSEAFATMRAQKGGAGTPTRPINIRPTAILVPVDLEMDALSLMGSNQLLITGDTDLKIAADNPHRNKYEVIAAPHLSDTYYTGASAVGWYLFSDPNQVAAYELCFLNGVQTPTIEQMDAGPNVLGLTFRGYIDFGVNTQDPRGAVFAKGEV